MITGFVIIGILIMASHEASVNKHKEINDRLNRIIRGLEDIKKKSN